MDSNMNLIPHFRPSCATKIEGRWVPGDSWVRTMIHNAIRRTKLFFLRPWDGVEVAWTQWIHADSSVQQSESEGREPQQSLWDRLHEVLASRFPGFTKPDETRVVWNHRGPSNSTHSQWMKRRPIEEMRLPRLDLQRNETDEQILFEEAMHERVETTGISDLRENVRD